MVVILDVDGILRRDDTRTLAEARPIVDAFAGSHLVLCSSRSAAEVRALQREAGIREPFISDGGTRVNIPPGYFCGVSAAPSDECETIDFGVRRLAHAVRLVVALFRSCPEPPLVVGVGVDWRDRVLLHEVDVPVVIRVPAVDQGSLLRNVPHARVADLLDRAALAQFVFGHGSVGRA